MSVRRPRRYYGSSWSRKKELMNSPHDLRDYEKPEIYVRGVRVVEGASPTHFDSRGKPIIKIRRPSIQKKKKPKITSSAKKKKQIQQKKKKRKIIKKNEVYTPKQKEKYNQIMQELNEKESNELREMLDKNEQNKQGTKRKLLWKVADGIVLGKIEKCPTCKQGKLEFDNKTGIQMCNGWKDELGNHHCNKKFNFEEIKRDEWIN